MFRSTKLLVPPASARYFIVNVFDPAVNDVIRKTLANPARAWYGEFDPPKYEERVSLAAMVVAPLTANDA